MKVETNEGTVFLNPADRMSAGLHLLSETVQRTLGPAGQLVAITGRLGAAPTCTKDGVTVARHVQSPDPVAQAAIATVVTAANEMNTQVGDGTTSATIITCELATNLLNLGGNDYQHVLDRIRKYAEPALNAVSAKATPISADCDMLQNIAAVACNGDKRISSEIAAVVSKVGKDGVVTYQDSPSAEIYHEVCQGLTVERGYASSQFLPADGSPVVTLGNSMTNACLVFVSADPLTSSEEVAPLLHAALPGKQALLVIAPDVIGDALAALIINSRQNKVSSCVVRSPSSGERRAALMQDIALATGGTLYGRDHGGNLRDMSVNDVLGLMGRAGSVLISDRQTILTNLGGSTSTIDTHVAGLRARMLEQPLEAERLRERIAQLIGAVGTVYVPGANYAEKASARFTVEDGIKACFSALHSGVVPGGGASYKLMAQVVQRQRTHSALDVTAKDILLKALVKPLQLLLANALDGGTARERTHGALAKLLSFQDFNRGYDVRTMKPVDLMSLGIYEPAILPITAVRLAMSCASTLGATRAVIVPQPAK